MADTGAKCAMPASTFWSRRIWSTYAARMVNTEFCSSQLPTAWLVPQWPAIAGVQAVFSTRHGGVSQAPWNSLNLGGHVGDACAAVARNRAILESSLSASATHAVKLQFLEQVHGWQVQHLPCAQTLPQADASITDLPGYACTVMVADCLPVLIAHRRRGVIGAAHAGWRGLVGHAGWGVLEALWDAYAHLVRQHEAHIGHTALVPIHRSGWGLALEQQLLRWEKMFIGPSPTTMYRQSTALRQAPPQANGWPIWLGWRASD